MNQVNPIESETVLFPPWSKKRRWITAIIMSVFVLGSGSLLGAGLYQIGVNSGLINRPFSKQNLVNSLLNDAGFIRAVNKSVSLKPCQNEALGFGFNYQTPFTLLGENETEMCTKLVALHNTGVDVLVEVKPILESREIAVSREVQLFESVDTSLMGGTAFPTSRLTGIKQGIPTEMYIVGIDRQKAFQINYFPTDPTLTGKVINIVESFYSIPQ